MKFNVGYDLEAFKEFCILNTEKTLKTVKTGEFSLQPQVFKAIILTLYLTHRITQATTTRSLRKFWSKGDF